jgi:hypothetical protein
MPLIVLSGAVSTKRRVSRPARRYTAAHKNGMEILIKFRDDSQSPKAVPRQAASLFVLEFRSSDVRSARRREFNPSSRRIRLSGFTIDVLRKQCTQAVFSLSRGPQRQVFVAGVEGNATLLDT